jgi:hypothetical protein
MKYKISTSNKVVRCFFSACFIIGGCCLYVIPIKNDNSNAAEFILGAILLIAGSILIADTLQRLLTLDDYGITLKGFSTNRTFAYNEIKGFRISSGKTTVLIIVPLISSTRSLRIGSDFEKFDEIRDQIRTKLKDLDEEAYQQENQQILSNEDFGSSETEREANKKRATKLTGILTAISGILFFIRVIVNFYDAIFGLIAFGIIAIAFYFIWHYKGLIQIFDKNNKSAFAVIAPAILLSAALLAFLAITGFSTICNYSNFWEPAFTIFVITLVIVFWTSKKALQIANSKIGSIIILVIFSGIFAYGATIFGNHYFDESTAKEYDVTILDKSISTSSKGHKSYWIQLPAWGIMQNPKQNEVSHNFYDSIEIGDTVHVYLKMGKLGIPWYTIEH